MPSLRATGVLVALVLIGVSGHELGRSTVTLGRAVSRVMDHPLAVGWPVTGGDAGGSRHSPLEDIRRDNVRGLKVAWTYRHGDYRDPRGPDRVLRGTAFEATPILARGHLIFTTPFNRVIALDPESGAERWTFDPQIDRGRRFPNMMVNRGVAFWEDGRRSGPCNARIFLGTLDARLMALDAETGIPCLGFGRSGTVSLLEGLDDIVDPWEYNVTSPPTVVGDIVITGSSIADIVRRIQPSGAVRAFDARTGALRWQFETVPRPGTLGHDTWEGESWREAGGANVWSTITADLERGWVFLPVSTAGPDFFGGDRKGANLFSDAVVALDARTGHHVWHFQTVHHDLWDYDLAAPPALVRIRRDGRLVDAVAQATKTGFVFVLDRETGRPIFPVVERPVPATDVPDERAWPTQPIPAAPPPLVPQTLTEADLWDRDISHYARCRARLAELRNDGLFTPPSLGGSLVYPYTAGGANWSGTAFDEARQVLVVPVNNLAHTVRLRRLPPSNLSDTDGRVMRTGLAGLWWLLTGRGTGLRYRMDRELFAVNGIPCNRPPHGMLVGVRLDRGEIAWSEPIGTNFGPALTTASGLVFHGGTRDNQLRVHDLITGRLIAAFALPAGLHGGPVTYRLAPGRKQFIVVAPGGHVGLGSTLGDYVIAYTL